MSARAGPRGVPAGAGAWPAPSVAEAIDDEAERRG